MAPPPAKKAKLVKETPSVGSTGPRRVPKAVVLSCIQHALDLTPDEEQRDFIDVLSSVNRVFLDLVAPQRFASLRVTLPNLPAIATRITQIGSFARNLSIELDDLYALGNKGAKPWKGFMLKKVLREVKQTIESLSCKLGGNIDPLHYLDLKGSLMNLPNLRSFVFHGHELWLSSLADILISCPNLSFLDISMLRADCSTPFHLPATCQIKYIHLHSNTLNSTHIRTLLKHQINLTHLELALPGSHESSVFQVLEAIAPTLEHLHLSDRFTYKPGFIMPSRKDGSPLIPILEKASRLAQLALYSSLAAPDELEAIFELSTIRTLASLTIQDTATSGLREAVQAAVSAGKMTELTELVSVGANKTSAKSMEALCKKAGIEWVRQGKA